MDRQPVLVLTSESPEQTREIGSWLSGVARVGDLVLLHGDLGAGKTTFTQGIARGLGVEDYVQSPTFTLVNEHDGTAPDGTTLRLYHLDLYRLAGEADLESFGFEQYLAPVDGITLVEWPERAAAVLPEEYLLVRLVPLGANARQITIEAVPPEGMYEERLDALRERQDPEG
ncbi:MAG: tRNA (adenosine(37)-N6)-threonylcarbamoyltransferase complex ATPase subunit type 1 TsaE [Chloroflexota bacterium]|nr:tRNA (adenosine(37)-N6)-threonylcarbamoyltransferase complex ATPase subunit type 1 TsaE [Chloroflexota bacterium]